MSLYTKEIVLKIKTILGVTAPFVQGGSIRLTLPKRMVKKHDVKHKISKEYFGYIFVETDKGILLVSMDKAVNPDNIRNALGFVDLTHLTREDLKVIFEGE